MLKMIIPLGLLTATGAAIAVVSAETKDSPIDSQPPTQAAHDAEGIIVFYPFTSCPGDFTEATSAQGRVIVGLPVDGQIAGQQGVALGDQEQHLITDIASHTHPVNPPATASSVHDHDHGFDLAAQSQSAGTANGSQGVSGTNDNTVTTDQGDSLHSHQFALGQTSLAETGAATGANATTPYVQLIGCETRYALNGFPADAVTYVSGAACPQGWSALAEARGRILLGASDPARVGSSLGGAMTNMETITTTEVVSHAHSVDPAPITSAADGAHSHNLPSKAAATAQGNDGFTQETVQASNNVQSSGSPHSHSVDIPTTASSSTGAAEVDVTMPYVQLLVCRKDA